MPASHQPRTETEKALQGSLKSMELQCKERVDLLEALRKSRQEAEEDAKGAGAADAAPSKSRESLPPVQKPNANGEAAATTWLGGDTVPQASYADLPRPTSQVERRPAPPPRPSYASKRSSTDDILRSKSLQIATSPMLEPPSTGQPRARTPSPEKKGGMLKTLRSNPKDRASSGKMVTTLRNRPPPAAAKAATQVWSGPQRPSSTADVRSSSSASVNTLTPSTTWDPYTRSLVDRQGDSTPDRRISDNSTLRTPSPTDYLRPTQSRDSAGQSRGSYPPPYPEYRASDPYAQKAFSRSDESVETARASPPPPVPPHRQRPAPNSTDKPRPPPPSLSQMGPSSLSYMKEFPNHPPAKPKKTPAAIPRRTDRTSLDSEQPERSSAPPKTVQAKQSPAIPRKAVTRAAGIVSATSERQKLDNTTSQLNDRVKSDPESQQAEYTSNSSPERTTPRKAAGKQKVTKSSSKMVGDPGTVTPPTTEEEEEEEEESQTDSADEASQQRKETDRKIRKLLKNLPKGVDETAAKQIFNEIVIQGDEVHWSDVAGLDIAKSALKETVVYPFLRPDLFMGLREPARGMLLFGPPGTGKTMLARAVATESRSVFFAISASSLTSKYLGESEKLVRALFVLAKAMAPSIIFVDEIDSLLGSRGGGSEHEATRRIKTEFLIQWSDLQKAAAGREEKAGGAGGDATRVLVLAATNLPWAIDEAARRRFVRRQYIPLPEDWVREQQLRTLLASQKHNLSTPELKQLVELTDGFSGSDVTALAKDAAMGPLRSLGERLLRMKPEEIRGIEVGDFRASLVNIRPSVSRSGLREYEQWAGEFGERGG